MREGWKKIELGEIIHIKHGYGFKGEYFVDTPNNNFLITPGNFAIGGGFKADKMKYYDGPINQEFVLSAGDVIVTMTDLSKEADTLGYSAKIPNDPENTYLHNQRIGLVSLKSDEYDLDYIYWLLRTYEYQRYIAGSSSGATVKHTSPTKIYSCKVLVTENKNTQRKIASILSSYDDLIENNLKRIKLLEEKAQRTYEEWFVKMRFPGHETAVFNQETGLPEGWEKVKLGEVAEFKYGKMPKSEQLTKTGFPVYSGYRITGFTNKYLFEKPTLIVVARGVGGTGDVKISPEKCWLTNLSIAVVVKNNIFQNYLYYFLKDSNLRSLDSGAAQSQITIANLESYLVINADFNLQSLFNDFVDKIFKNINILQTQNRLLKEARDILLPRLMSGMVDVEELQIETIIK